MSYRERLHAGYYEPTEPEADPPAPAPLPGTHDKLNALAEERGHEWSDENLSIAGKRAELAEEAGA